MIRIRLFGLALLGAAVLFAWPALHHQAPSAVPLAGPAQELRQASSSTPPPVVGASVGGPKHADGTEVDCDLPGALHRRNVSSRGQGCCVFTSLGCHAAVWQSVPALQEFPTWLQSKGLPGGGEPSNVKARITAICKERGYPEPKYLQVQGGDLEILKAACRSGRMPGVTYSFSPTGRYGGKRIAHMVNLVHADDRHFVILDNNYPGESNYEWLTPAEFSRVYAPGWAVILLDPGPPPAPKNLKRR